jgi:hypothetical protein
MALRLVVAASEYPLALSDAKAHLRVTDSTEDTLITALIIAATEWAEGYTNLRFCTQTWEKTSNGFPPVGRLDLKQPLVNLAGLGFAQNGTSVLDALPLGRIELLAPLQSLVSVNYLDTTGNNQLLSGSAYQADLYTQPGFICPAWGLDWPVARLALNSVRVQFVVGFGAAAAVPLSIKQALLLLIGHLYLNREATSGFAISEIPYGVEALLARHRVITIP